MATLVYSPAVEVVIATRRNGVIDVTEDLQQGALTLNANAPHNFSFSLLNPGRKYDGVFTPNDRISVRMKRITWLQIFAGYLDDVPMFSAYPRTIPLSATCSLKRLQYHLWDSGTQDSFNLIHGPGAQGQDPMSAPDSGLKQIAMRMLVNVAGWPVQNIHIGALPSEWFSRISDLWTSVQGQIDASKVTLGAGATVNGSSAQTDGVSSLDTDPTHQLPATTGKASWFGGPGGGAPNGFALTGESGISPNDPWYCAMRWPYAHYQGDLIVTVPNYQAVLNWWKNRTILVTATSTGKSVVLRAADWGPGGVATADARVIDMSQEALESVLGIGTDGDVQICFAPPGAQPGPYTSSGAGATPAPVSASATGYATSSPGTGTNATGASAAIAFAEQQVGKPYQWGGTGNPSYDCSGLTQAAWKAAGVDIPRTSEAQYNAVIKISQADLQPGDLIFYEGIPPGHVTLYVGNNQMVEAPHTGVSITLRNVYPGAIGYGRVLGFTPGAAASGTNAGTGAFLGPGANGWTGSGPDDVSTELTGVRALLNDSPILPDIQNVLFASMRSYCSAPNGDFIAWFPDYFGQYGTCGKVVVQPIELQDFSIMWSDRQLITHEFAMGAVGVASPSASNTDPGQVPVDDQRMFQTAGIASIDFPQILQALFNIGPDDDSVFSDAQEIMARFGARVNHENIGIISSDQAEFWYALFQFMKFWAQQFSTVAPMTFMPELFPGMLVEFAGYGVQCYVEGVTHNFNFAEGGSFSTNASITAPSSTDGKGAYGLVRGGPRAPAPPAPTLGAAAGSQPTSPVTMPIRTPSQVP